MSPLNIKRVVKRREWSGRLWRNLVSMTPAKLKDRGFVPLFEYVNIRRMKFVRNGNGVTPPRCIVVKYNEMRENEHFDREETARVQRRQRSLGQK